MSLTLLRIARWSLAPALALATTAQAQCPAPMQTSLVERFLSADCEACWRAGIAPKDALALAPFVLDWIVPSPRGGDAALSPAALDEAAARAGELPPGGLLQRRQTLQLPRGLSISVQDGPAWSGYIAVRLRVQVEGAALPAGVVGYLALVELVPAGNEGTPIERRLVRALAGPLLLDNALASTDHLLALRMPPGARPDRLAAVGWIEASSGKVIALAPATRGDCSAEGPPGA